MPTIPQRPYGAFSSAAERSRILAALAEENEGRSFVGQPCTLDGKPAEIIGRLLHFGTVATLPHGPSYEYSWETIARVMRAGGTFKS